MNVLPEDVGANTMMFSPEKMLNSLIDFSCKGKSSSGYFCFHKEILTFGQYQTLLTGQVSCGRQFDV
jgi:hypothetical protein